jgi:hypothetical protein
VNNKPDMALPDQDTSMVNGFGHATLENNGLETALEEVLNRKSKHIIELVLALTKETIAVHAAEQRLTLKDTAGVLLVQGEQLPCCISDAAQGILHTPRLTLAPQAILTHKLQLSIKALLLIWTSWLLEGLPIFNTSPNHKLLVAMSKLALAFMSINKSGICSIKSNSHNNSRYQISFENTTRSSDHHITLTVSHRTTGRFETELQIDGFQIN